jgi:hypothetical protein
MEKHRSPLLSDPSQEEGPEPASLNQRRRTEDLNAEALPPTIELLSDEAWLADMTQRGLPPVIAQACVAFRHDLPALLAEGQQGQWAAYHGAERLAIGPSKTLLYRCFTSQGIDIRDLFVRLITPEMSYYLGARRSS